MAMRISDFMPVGLIGVDSGQIYCGMDIGTAKPTADELLDYPHALIDVREPSEAYSADEFRADALRSMHDIREQGKTPLLVGGTMFYFRALQYGLPDLPPADESVREQLLLEARESGWQALHDRLAAVDPESARRINPNDRQRIQRALEIYILSGITPTQHARRHSHEIPWNVIKIGLWPSDRRLLHENISKRLDMMFEQGFLDEVKALHARGLANSLPALRAVGYRQVLEHLDGNIDYEEMRLRCLFSTRQLAKRQLTWLRKENDLHWFDSKNDDYQQKVLEFIKKKTSV